MSIVQATPPPGQIVHDDPGMRAPGVCLWSMASGVLLLALS